MMLEAEREASSANRHDRLADFGYPPSPRRVTAEDATRSSGKTF